MLFVHYCAFLLAYCAVVMAGYFDAIKVCCEAVVTCVAAQVTFVLSTKFHDCMFKLSISWPVAVILSTFNWKSRKKINICL